MGTESWSSVSYALTKVSVTMVLPESWAFLLPVQLIRAAVNATQKIILSTTIRRFRLLN